MNGWNVLGCVVSFGIGFFLGVRSDDDFTCMRIRESIRQATRIIPAEKLRILADWFDRYGFHNSVLRFPGHDVQKDLRRLADYFDLWEDSHE